MVNTTYDELLRRKQDAEARAKALRTEAYEVERVAIEECQKGCAEIGHIFGPVRHVFHSRNPGRECQVCGTWEPPTIVCADITGEIKVRIEEPS